MKAVFGLGNPGLEYALTRHNVGFDLVDLYRKQRHPRLKGQLLCSSLVYEATGLLLVKPKTYMNASGDAVKAAIDRFGIDHDAAIIVYDDLDIPIGEMKILPAGGPGSHKGMISIIETLGIEAIPRMRIGIGRGQRPEDQAGYVLSRFSENEWGIIYSVLEYCADAIAAFRNEDIHAIMTRFNRRGRVVDDEQGTIL